MCIQTGMKLISSVLRRNEKSCCNFTFTLGDIMVTLSLPSREGLSEFCINLANKSCVFRSIFSAKFSACKRVPDHASLEENYLVILFKVKKVSLFFWYCLGLVSSPAMLPSFLQCCLCLSIRQKILMC